MLTLSELKKVLHYDPTTGIFTWLVRRGNKKPGDIAGYTDINIGYSMVRYRGELYLSHRLAWFYTFGYFPKYQLDHINNVRNDNRIVNLRESSNQENNCNKFLTKSNKSGVKGVSWHKKANKWSAEVWSDYKKYYLGLFENKSEAENAVIKKRSELHGEFVNHG